MRVLLIEDASVARSALDAAPWDGGAGPPGPALGGRYAGASWQPARRPALYLYQGDRDTLYRIHGTAEAWSIGKAVSSGCVRLLNADVIDLYNRVPTGTRVVVRWSRGIVASEIIQELEQG